MNENESLREQMWDLCYGLLTADEVAALHKQIKSDPAAARLYAEVRLQADLVASAAKVEDASVTLSVPDEGRKVQPAAKKHSGPGESPFKSNAGRSDRKSFRTPSYQAANWLAGLAATALVALIGYGFYAPSRQGKSPSDDQVVAYVYGNNSLQSGLTQNLKVVAKTSRGEPASTELSYQVYFANGEMALRDVVKTDKDGEAQLSLPGSAIQPGSRLEVQAQKNSESEVDKETWEERTSARKTLREQAPKVVVPLLAKEEPITTDVQLERGAYQAGDTVRFRVHAWRTFSNEPATAAEEWKLVAQDGREIPPKAIDLKPEAGSVAGEFQLPEDAPAGDYRLVGIDRKSGTARELERVVVGMNAEAGEPNQRRALALHGYRQLKSLQELDALALARSEDSKAKMAESKKQSMEKGKAELTRGSASPTPLASNAPTAPAPAEGHGETPPAPAAAFPPAPREKDAAKNGLAADPGKRADSLFLKGEPGTERLQGTLAEQNSLSQRAELKDRIAETDQAVQTQGDAITVPVPPELARKKLLVVVSKENSPVATMQYDGVAAVDTRATRSADSQRRGGVDSPEPAPAKEPSGKLADSKSNAGEEQSLPTLLTVQLPPEADGELGVTFYDQSKEPSQPVLRQLVRRNSHRGMNIEVAAVQQNDAGFAPQEELQLKIKATDQKGREVPHSWFAARIVKLGDDIAQADAGSNLRFAADKAADGSRGRPLAPGAVGGAGFGGGKGSSAKDGDAKESNSKDEKRDFAEREAAEKQARKKEAILQTTEAGPAKPGEVAAKTSPAAPAGAAGVANSSRNGALPSQVELKPSTDEDRSRAGQFDSPFSYSGAPVVGHLEIPQEVLLGSNDGLIQDAIRAKEAAAQSARVSFQHGVGRVVLVLAVVALMIFGVLAVLHRPAEAKVWVPAMAVVSGSFVVGSIWLLNGKFASMEVAAVPDAGLHKNRERYHDDFRPMAPAANSPSEPATISAESSSALGMKEQPAPLAMESLEKFNEKSSGPGIGPTVEVAPEGPVPKAEEPAPKAIPGPAGAGGSPGGARKAEEAPPAPAPKAEAGAKPGESKFGFNREEGSKDAADLKGGNEGKFNPQKPALMKSMARNADRDKRDNSPQLLWEPNLPANQQGEAELNLQLPSEPGDYVLIVDVQGPHGVGTVQKHIPVRVPPPAPAAAPAAPSKP